MADFQKLPIIFLCRARLPVAKFQSIMDTHPDK